MSYSNVILVNNTPSNITMFTNDLIAAVRNGALPEELADIFTLTIVAAEDGVRGILNAA